MTYEFYMIVRIRDFVHHGTEYETEAGAIDVAQRFADSQPNEKFVVLRAVKLVTCVPDVRVEDMKSR